MQSVPPIEPKVGLPSGKAWLLWIAISGSLLIYAVVGVIVRQNNSPDTDPGLFTVLIPALILVSATETMLVLTVWGRLFARKSSYLNYCVVRWALAESVGIFGLVLTILGASTIICASFFIWSALLFVLLAPTRGDRQRFANLNNPALNPTS